MTEPRPNIVKRMLANKAELARFMKFAVVGASGVVVNMGVLWAGKNFIFGDLPYKSAIAWAGFLAIAVSIVTNFLLNDAWTWGDRRNGGLAAFGVRFAKYTLVASIAGVVQWLVLQALVHIDVHYLLANAVGIGAGIVINYAANNWWTFRANADDTPPSDVTSDLQSKHEQPHATP